MTAPRWVLRAAGVGFGVAAGLWLWAGAEALLVRRPGWAVFAGLVAAGCVAAAGELVREATDG